jgi:hypothetical protein
MKQEDYIYVALRKKHIYERNNRAALTIQTFISMWMIRKRYVAFLELRKEAASLLTSFFKKKLADSRKRREDHKNRVLATIFL